MFANGHMTIRRAVLALAAIGAFAVSLEACSDVATDPADREVAASSEVADAGAPDGPNSVAYQSAQRAAIDAVLSAFHGALNESDYDAIRALWSEDASLAALGQTATGPTEIADFFATSPPFVNGWAALAPTYNTRVEIHGNTATYGFECVYVPDTGNLAGQTVVAHLNASGTLRKVGDRWLFESFVGGVGPLP